VGSGDHPIEPVNNDEATSVVRRSRFAGWPMVIAPRAGTAKGLDDRQRDDVSAATDAACPTTSR
jgi:hypothetical protein